MADVYWLSILTNFWCLMFTVLAIGVGIAYFMIAWSSTKMSFVSLSEPLEWMRGS